MANEVNVANVEATKKGSVESVKSNIITDLKPETLGVSIHKIVKRSTEGREYFLMSAINLFTNENITLSASTTMIERFNLGHIIREGNFNTEVERPLYLNLEVTYVPNDGNRYGYERDGQKIEYQNKGTYIFRNVLGPLEGSIIRAAEAGRYAQAHHAKGQVEEAKVIFHEMKGRRYVPGVSEDDDEFFTKMLMLVRKG